VPSEFARAHVLIVDDDPTNRLLLREVCGNLGIGMIDEAEDGAVAYDLITRFRPDLILLDIRMPRMDGYALMHLMRGNKDLENVAVLVQTGLQDEEDRLQCFCAGATDVVSRPFNLAELQARIRAHLRSATAARVLLDFRNRIQAHLDITHTFLDSVLPTHDSAEEMAKRYGLSCTFVYKPHDEIGGDLWSLRSLNDDCLAIVLVDASAHGLAGAINALRVDCLVQEYHGDLENPSVFLTKLDAAMAKIAFGQLFAGAVAMTYRKSSGEIRFAGTNIPSLLLWQGGQVTELRTRGLPLGSGMVEAPTATLTLPEGATIVLSTDGWMDGDPAAGAKAFAKVDANEAGFPESLIPKTPSGDDLTVIALRRG
jgi:sigma-B regulation protein RsbU (phosphoserine phosphatase)